MAIQKKASVKKVAGAFRNYRVPVGANGQPLAKNKHNEYIDPATGQVYDPDTQGMARHIMRPVLTEEDLRDKDNFPLQARTLNIKKYQEIIKELREAVTNSKCGVVNYVVGEETENAEAILKAAFPPGSGVVYNGFEGYDYSATKWGNIGQAREKLREKIKGSKSSIDRQTLEQYRRITTDISTRPAEGNRARPATPLSVLKPAPASLSYEGGGGNDAVPLGGGAAAQPPPGTDTGLYEWILNRIDELNAGLEETQQRMRAIDNRHDQERDPSDPDGMSKSKQYNNLLIYQNKLREELAMRQSELPDITDDFGNTVHDGTGFLDVSDAKKLYGRLLALLDPQKVVEFHMSDSGARGTAPNDQMIRRVYDKHKAEMVDIVMSLQRSAPVDLQKSAENVLTIIQKSYEEIRAAKGALEKSISIMCTKIASQNRIFIINNVDSSALVAQTGQGESDQKPLRFLGDDILVDEFVPKQIRNKKVIIMVSRVPIAFGFQGVIQVPNNVGQFLVDEDEGVALVNFCIERCRSWVDKKIVEMKKRLAENNRRIAAGETIPANQIVTEDQIPSPLSVDVSNTDIQRLAQIIAGKTQIAAYGFLTQVFAASLNKKTGAVAGADLSREARRKNNEDVREGTTYTDTAGRTFHLFHAMTRKEAKMTIDQYIYSPRTDWGTKVKEIDTTIKGVQSLMKQQTKMMAKEHQLKGQEGGATGAAAFETKQQIMSLERKINLIMHNRIKHFIILYGAAGCGKSAYPEAFANQLGFDFVDCDLGQTKGGLVGQSESFFRAMLESWKRMSNVVIRIDEMDGQVAGEEEESRASHSANPMKQLLTFFQDNEGLLKQRNIFVIGTTNHLDRLRTALKDRAELNDVPMPFDQEGYEAFLRAAIKIIKRDQPMGLISPQSYNHSADLWPETEQFWNTLEPDFPQMARALIPTGLNFRRLIDFIVKMFAKNEAYVDSIRRINLYNNDRATYMEEYSSFAKKDENGNIVEWPKPEQSGFPFTADSFCRAAALTYPVDRAGRRVDPMENRDNVERVVFGTEALEREARGMGVGDAVPSAQSMLDLQGSGEDLMPPASATTVASNDYYYDQLVKSGFAAKVAAAQKKAQAQAIATAQPEETEKQMISRIDKGDIRPEDSFELGDICLIPVSGRKDLRKN